MNSEQALKALSALRRRGCCVPGCVNNAASLANASDAYVAGTIDAAHLPGAPKARDSHGRPIQPNKLARRAPKRFALELAVLVPMCKGHHTEADRLGMHHAHMLAAAQTG